MSKAFDLADKLVGGELRELLTRWRDEEGLSFEKIADLLEERTGVPASRETVRRWYGEIREEDQPEGSAVA